MTQPVKFGIIGTGAIAGQHAAAIKELPEAELVAVCSSSPERANQAEEKLGVKAYSNWEDFLAHPGMEAVSICTASGHHMEPAIKAAHAGKHILVEKPVEINLERAEMMIKACEDNGVKLGVVFQNRFNKDFIRLKEAVSQGELGKLLMGNAYIKWFRDKDYYASSQWKGTFKGDGGGALINQGIHTIDLLLDIMGDVEAVYGQVKTTLYDIEGEDLGTSVVNFKNGALGNITGGTALYPGYPERLEIFGTEGSVILEAGKIVEWNIRGQEPGQKVQKDQQKSGSADPMAIGHQLHLAQFKDMVEAIRNDRSPLVDGTTAKKALAVVLGIYQSSGEGQQVKVQS
ncbi:Gfo/Idh/MocA family oxidoreductase [Echinicola jeungdonensis]|uniref:Gfo/Idh/MocA family protein n=1 Tax=Echinicola jeungdonensis TaxID=709343 RepID=A0ABV5J3X7_9BACT|nr:Gfo/Idh/MocA family oxidoreductase [Echinicola jeungdonensis]MDN3670644.1 Gfo/Idh/MocA family oxidoreductase [Echinicola jeungdonensis]